MDSLVASGAEKSRASVVKEVQILTGSPSDSGDLVGLTAFASHTPLELP